MENPRLVTKLDGSKKKKCETHGEYMATSYKMFSDKVYWTNCPKCDKEFQDKADEFDRKQLEQQRERLLIAIGISKRFTNATLENYKPVNKKASENLKIIKSYCDNFKEIVKNGSSLILCGTPGTGKTHLACAMTIKLTDLKYPSYYTTSYKMMSRIKATYGKYAEEIEQNVLHKLITSKLLIIDEIGVQFGSDAEKVLFYQIINGRYDNILPTVLISNLTVKELVEFIGDRCFDRLKEGSGVVLSFDWDSYRK